MQKNNYSVGEGEGLGDEVGDGRGVGVGEGRSVGDGLGDTDGEGLSLGEGVGVLVGNGEGLGVGEGEFSFNPRAVQPRAKNNGTNNNARIQGVLSRFLVIVAVERSDSNSIILLYIRLIIRPKKTTTLAPTTATIKL